MKLNRRSALAIAIVAGALAAVMLYAYIRRTTTGVASPALDTVEVVIAADDITAQSVIRPEQLGTQVRGRAEAPRGAAPTPESVAGRVALVNLPRGEVIRIEQVAEPSPALGLAHVVPEHMRAVTVGMDPISGVAGFLKPGNRVDVLATINEDDITVTLTVLQNVELLALGQQAQPTPEDTPKASGRPARPDTQASATLAVTPEQAQRLFLAESKGKLRLALRAVEDHSRVELARTLDWEVTGIRPKETARASAPVAASGPPVSSAGYPPWWYTSPYPPMQHASGPQAVAGALSGWAASPEQAGSSAEVEILRGNEREVVNVNE